MRPEQICFESERFSGTQGYVHWWKNSYRSDTPPRGYVIIVHGLGEHGGRYAEVASFLCQLGFDVAAPDLPGHGLSSSKWGQTRCYALDEITAELRSLTNRFFEKALARKSGSPWYLLSHSLGSLVALNWMIDGKRDTDLGDFAAKAFVSAPPIQLLLKVPLWKEKISQALLKISPDLKLSNEIDPEMLSYDAGNSAAYRNDPLVHEFSSPRQYESIKDTAHKVRIRAADVEVPVFLAVGEDDPVVDPQGVKDFYHSLGTHKKFLIVPGAKHEILNETNRAALYQEIAGWFLS